MSPSEQQQFESNLSQAHLALTRASRLIESTSGLERMHETIVELAFTVYVLHDGWISGKRRVAHLAQQGQLTIPF